MGASTRAFTGPMPGNARRGAVDLTAPIGGPKAASEVAAAAMGGGTPQRKRAKGGNSTLLGDIKAPTTKAPSLLNGGSY